MAGNSPKYENLVLSNLSSPRFDISDFLKTPTDGSSDEAFCNLSGFNLPTPTFNTLTSLPSFSSSRNSRGDGSQEPDFTSLFDAKVEESDGACLDNALSSELIAFDDIEAEIARESFALFDNSHCDLVVDSVSPVRFHAIYPTPLASRMPTSNFPPSTLFNQAGSYLASEPGNLLEVEEHVLASMERGASTSGGPNALYARNLLDWGMPAEVVGCQPNMRQQATSPCDNCQLLRRIIHSNGVQDTKLEIHGLDGHSYHAVLQTRFCIDDGFPSTLEQQMVEFPVGNAEYVKQFLLQYSLLRRKEGFVIRHDSLQIPTDLGASMSIGCDRVIGGSATCIPKQTDKEYRAHYCDFTANYCRRGRSRGRKHSHGDCNAQE